MFELIMIIAAIILMVKVADAEGRSEILWAGITVAICFACLFIPLPLIRIVIAVVVSYGIMFGLKLAAD